VRRVAALGAVLGSLLVAAPAAAEQLTVMTFNVWYGGVQVEFDRIGAAIEASEADAPSPSTFEVTPAEAPPLATAEPRVVRRGTHRSPAGLRPGAYRAGLVSGEGEVVGASRFWVLAPDARPRIRTSRRVYAPGEPIRLRWSGMPGNRFDWIGIFRARPTLNVYGYLGFSYVGALPAGRMTMTTADLGRLPPGRYVAGLFMDDGYAILARTRFKIARSG